MATAWSFLVNLLLDIKFGQIFLVSIAACALGEYLH
jgi:hypothetical protein